MVAVGLGERDESGAVEVDPVGVDEVRIPPRVHPAGAEVDLARGGVHLVHAPHQPRAFRDLTLHPARDAVVQVEVVPPVALGHPDDFLSVGELEAVLLRRVLEEGGHRLRDDGARLPGRRIDLDHAERLVAALVVLERHGAPVLPPDERRHVVSVREEGVGHRDLLRPLDLEEHRLLGVEHIAGLVVEERGVLGLELVFGRRENVVDFPAVARTHAVGGEALRVR